MKHCMGTCEKAARFAPETVPLLPGISVFSFKRYDLLHPDYGHVSAEAGGQVGKAARKKFSVFRLHGFTGRQTPVNERDSVKDGVRA